jgi:uncharacterized protein (DUF433 family)
MTTTVFNICGNELSQRIKCYMPETQLKQRNLFDKIRANYTTIAEIKKDAAKSEYKKYIKENIIRNKKIRKGHPTIKGTRLTPEDIACLITKNEGKLSNEDILKEYPSLSSEKQIDFALLYFIEKKIRNPLYYIVCLIMAR